MLCLLAAASAEAQTRSLDVDYDGAGLTRIGIHGGTLRHVWHTGRRAPKTGMPVMAQSLAAHDEHVSEKRLSPAQIAWLNVCMDRNHVFSLRRIYPTTQPGSYGAAFRFIRATPNRPRRRLRNW